MNKLATLDKYVILNEDNPIGYTFDIYSCICLLIHRENSSVLSQIFTGLEKGKIDLVQLNEVLNLPDDKINYIEIFIGSYTLKENIDIISKIIEEKNIPFVILDSFKDMYNRGSIGYDYITHNYYEYDDTKLVKKRLKK